MMVHDCYSCFQPGSLVEGYERSATEGGSVDVDRNLFNKEG